MGEASITDDEPTGLPERVLGSRSGTFKATLLSKFQDPPVGSLPWAPNLSGAASTGEQATEPVLVERDVFVQHVTEALESTPVGIAVLYVEIDRFRSLTIAFGHDAGEGVLSQALRRIRRIVGSEATFTAQSAGFGVLLPDVNDQADVFALAEQLRWELAEPYESQTQSVGLSSSIGIALAQRGEIAAELLLQQADAASQAAGESGGNRVAAFESRTQIRALTRVRGGAELREALERSEFRLHYQPAMALGDSDDFGVEALIRWISPDGRMVMPMNFIPLAEETGFIVPLGSWVFEQACVQLASWEAAGFCPNWLSVNLSARQLYLPQSVESFERALSDTGADPRRIVVEITESALMEETPLLWHELERLRGLGVSISIDDFGTRYSSLTYLRRFTFDTLKVDRSFTSGVATDPRDRKIVANVINLAHDLSLDVVVEGIENVEQLEVVRELGADWAQGFYLSRPVPASQLQAIMADPAARAGRKIGLGA